VRSGVLGCERFSVFHAFVSVEAFAKNLTTGTYDDRTDMWIGGRERDTLTRQVQRATHVAFVILLGHLGLFEQ